MKTAIAITLILLIAHAGHSQTATTDSVNPLFKGELNGDRIRAAYDNFEPVIIQGKVKGPYNAILLSIFHSKNLYTQTALNPKEQLKELDPFATRVKPGYPYATMSNYPGSNAVPLFDSLPVIVTAYGINEKNKSMYRFRVLEDGQKELVSWREPQLFSRVMMYGRYNADGTEEKQMAYLGEFNAPLGNSITVEVKNLMQPDTVYKISAVWIKRAPSVIGTFGSDNLKRLIQVYKFQWKYDFFKPHASAYYGNIDLKPVDSLLKIDSIFDHDHNNLFFYLKDKVRSTDLVEFNLINDMDSSGWQANTFDPNLISLQQLTPGNYILLLRYSFQKQPINKFRFRIKQAWHQTFLFKILLIAVSLLFIGLLYSFSKSQNQRKVLRQQKIKRQQAEIDLRSIRSQFNPHFVFNALNSIQGLIRKKDTDSADKYLSDFSRLMQESLQSGDKEMTSLDKELKMLESYIELEKLRFKFNYTVSVNNKINIHTTEIPALLLQPLIENAIKHGISGMYNKGVLRIEIDARGNDLQIEIIDNGKGFDTKTITSGYGILLTKERTQLLSDLHPEQPLTLTINSGIDGTTAIILFKNWLI
ncbi:MAG: histidine kinase [Chitinophagaceae bacterium]|nr:histidine kinase [Chitinophagaceae bacterium]